MDLVLVMLTGFVFGLSLIVVIGAQNAFVLRQGLRREHVAAVVAFCALSDAALIIAGVGGLGAVIDAHPRVLGAMRIFAIVFLLGYAVIAARRAMWPQAIEAVPGGPPVTFTRAITTVAALTWLNPHVYVDTVLLLGSVARSQGDDRWWFGAGAAIGSVVWFSVLGYGARVLRPVFTRPAAWRVLDSGIAALLIVIAAGLMREL